MKTQYLCAIVLLFLLGTASCSVSRHYTTRSELKESRGHLLVLTADSSRYYLEQYSITDSTLEGSGTSERGNSVTKFDGRLPFHEITYIIGSPSIGFFDVLGFAGIVGAIIPNISQSGGPSGTVSAYEYPEPVGGGSSCPTVYSWNGSGYQLEGEAFGTALGKALEAETGTVLHSLKPKNAALKIRIANERPETHYVNSVRLAAVAHDMHSLVVLDCENQAWSVARPRSPVSAVDQSGRLVTGLIHEGDEESWRSDLATTFPGSTFQDQLVVEFDHEAYSKAGLVIRALNTQLSGAAFEKLYEILGHDAIDFVSAAEKDPETIALLKGWLSDASLHVSLWTQNGWREVAAILPEASEVEFERLVVLDPSAAAGERLRVKLNSLADVWEIDALSMDFTITAPLKMLPVRMVSATAPRRSQSIPTLSEADNHYLLLWPREYLDLEFAKTTEENQKTLTYILFSRGYLYEWPSSEHVFSGGFSSASRGKRLAVARTLLKNQGVMLPLIYGEWKKQRSGIRGQRTDVAAE